jgi:hypothetical protein
MHKAYLLRKINKQHKYCSLEVEKPERRADMKKVYFIMADRNIIV